MERIGLISVDFVGYKVFLKILWGVLSIEKKEQQRRLVSIVDIDFVEIWCQCL